MSAAACNIHTDGMCAITLTAAGRGTNSTLLPQLLVLVHAAHLAVNARTGVHEFHEQCMFCMCVMMPLVHGCCCCCCCSELEGAGIHKMKMLQKMRLLEEKGQTFASTPIKELKVFGRARASWVWVVRHPGGVGWGGVGVCIALVSCMARGRVCA
jgi:hypothetical protein